VLAFVAASACGRTGFSDAPGDGGSTPCFDFTCPPGTGCGYTYEGTEMVCACYRQPSGHCARVIEAQAFCERDASGTFTSECDCPANCYGQSSAIAGCTCFCTRCEAGLLDSGY